MATGEACEREARRWIAIEREPRYLEASRFRFEGELPRIASLGAGLGDFKKADASPSLF